MKVEDINDAIIGVMYTSAYVAGTWVLLAGGLAGA